MSVINLTPKFFVGVDISQLKLDLAVIHKKQVIHTCKIDNTIESIGAFIAFLKDFTRCKNRELVFCCEHGGTLTLFLTQVLYKKKIAVCLESPLRIRRSSGIIRNKTDKADAVMIANYAAKHIDQLRFWHPPRNCIAELKALNTLRERLVRIKVMLTIPSTSKKPFDSAEAFINEKPLSKASLAAVKKDIEAVQARMLQIVEGDDHLARLMSLVSSVPSIGPITSLQFLIYTNEFKDISCPRKFASYCGIAPFHFESGSSIKRRSKISHLANKKMKKTLHLCSIVCLRSKSDLSEYYMRKTAEGKHPLKVLNAIRNKLVHRVFSCVRNNALFVDRAALKAVEMVNL